jgi:hypothetical protein
LKLRLISHFSDSDPYCAALTVIGHNSAVQETSDCNFLIMITRCIHISCSITHLISLQELNPRIEALSCPQEV